MISLEWLEAFIVNWQVIVNAYVIKIIYDSFLFVNN